MKNRLISISIVGMLVIGGFVGLFIATDQVKAAGPTYVSGPITLDTTWYLADSPYIVTGDVTVESSATLTIEPGVEVKFDGVYSIIIDGKLIANGTSMNKIKFISNQTTPTKGDWYTIRLRTDYNIIDYAEIEYATYGIFMTFFGTHNTVSNTTVKYCKFDGIYITNSDNNLISNCTSSYNDRFGITIYESYRTHVDNCTIQYNNYFGINLNASTFTEIYDTNISYNDGKGILFYSNSHNTTISGCQIDWNNHIGIDLSGTSDNDIINTTVIGNNGVGIDFGGVTKYQWIENCTVMNNNETGIDLRGSSNSDIVGCNVSKNKGKGGIYSASPVSCININKTEVWNNLAGNGIDLNGTNWVNITDSKFIANVGNGIFFNGSYVQENNTIKNCTIVENSKNGIYFYTNKIDGISYIQNNNICFNTIYYNKGNGIYFYSYLLTMNSGERNIYLQGNNIYSNIIYSNHQNGIYLHGYRVGSFASYASGYVYIQDNNIYSNTIFLNNQNGIYLEAYTAHRRWVFSYIQDNNIYLNTIYLNNQNGIFLFSYVYCYSGADAYIQYNNIFFNTIFSNNQHGIYFNASVYYGYPYVYSAYIDNNNLYSNTIYLNGQNGIYFYVSSQDYSYIGNNNIYSNILFSNSQNGIYFHTYAIGGISYLENNNIYSNEIYQHSSGIGFYFMIHNPIEPWQESNIYNNTIILNMNGIILSNMNSQIIYANNISNNEEGILLIQSTSNVIRYNNITYNNVTGINLISSSNNNIIENNNITYNNKTGILITDNSNDNLITRNNITNNLEIGLNITGASGNQIHHNNFINNTQNAYDFTIALNDWDDGAEGNYWSDYLGTDDDGDGFGEDPYVISGGGSRDWHPFMYEVDVTAPYIVMTSPTDGEVNVPLDTNISITFSKEMNKTAVEGAISISGGLTPTNFVWDAENKTVTFTPSSTLQSRNEYTVTITTKAKDTQGNRIKITYVFKFTSEDIEAPKITLTSPYYGQINVDLNADVVVTFNESMQPSSVTYVCTPDPFGWSVSWNSNYTVAIFSHNLFGNKATYTFQILTAKDTAGLDLIPGPVPNPWTFTTKDIIGPEIVSTSPVDGSQNVSTTANIVVSFNEEIDLASVTYTCTPDPLGWSVIWSNNNKTATFSHNNFTERTLYTFWIIGAKDMAGNDLNPGGVPNPFSFTTTGDYVAPQITLTSPADTEANVQLDADIIVTFSEAMDTSSINYICIPDPGGWSQSWSNGDTVLTLSHNPFENATTYTFNINAGRDVAGNDIVTGAVSNPWSFTTIGDIYGPQITSTTPVNNDVNVGIDTNIVILFNEAIDPSSLNYTCSPDPGGWSVSWSSGNTVAAFSHNPFEVGTFYTFRVTSAKDISGNDLNPGPVPNPFSFTTTGDAVPPEITLTSPVDGEVNVDVDMDIVVTFSEAMYTPSLHYFCTPDPGGWSESWSNGNTVVTFSHNQFAIGATYTFHVTAAKDVTMNELNPGTVPNPWSFTTLGDLVAPQIISTSPVDNEVNVDLNTLIIVTFSEAMDTSTVEYTCSPDPGEWFESWGNGNTVFTLLHNPFEIGTTYTFQITAGKDLAGNNLTSGAIPHSWDFITISVDSLIVTPSEMNITVNETVVLIAWAYDSQNNLITDITYTWSVNNNLGTILQQGTQAVNIRRRGKRGA
jgi:parallel beta-helix repeat protein